METMDLKASQEKSDVVAEYQEVPKDEATVEIIRALEDWYGDRHLAIGCR